MNSEELKGILNLKKPHTVAFGKNYLFAIAINDYQFGRKLNNAVSDVEKFIEILTQRFSFEKENVTFLKDKEATKKRIEQEFIRFSRIITPVDNIVIYFSGHGRWDTGLGGYWVPVEANTENEDFTDYLSNDLVKNYLNRINTFHTFLIADSCFSGSLFIDKGIEKFTGDRRESEPSRWGLTSGKRELVSDGEPGKHSPFAIALLDVLNKADRPLGVITIIDRVLEKVVANAYQTPMGSPMIIQGHQGGQFVFHIRMDEESDWEAIRHSESVIAFQGFIQRHPVGIHAEEALMRITWLNEKTLLEQAKTVVELSSFISQADFTDLKNMARQKLKSLEDEESWQKAIKRNRLIDFHDYIDRFGEEGVHIENAKRNITKLLEAQSDNSLLGMSRRFFNDKYLFSFELPTKITLTVIWELIQKIVGELFYLCVKLIEKVMIKLIAIYVFIKLITGLEFFKENVEFLNYNYSFTHQILQSLLWLLFGVLTIHFVLHLITKGNAKVGKIFIKIESVFVIVLLGMLAFSYINAQGTGQELNSSERWVHVSILIVLLLIIFKPWKRFLNKAKR